MTLSRRNRKQPTVSRKPTTRSVSLPQQTQSPTPQDPIPEEEEDDEEDEDDDEERDEDEPESSEGGSVTRCLCGHQQNAGLMVQCDKCEVWQHCDCVGLTEKEIPELYYCDQCKPDNHVLYRSHGRFKRAYHADGKPLQGMMHDEKPADVVTNPTKRQRRGEYAPASRRKQAPKRQSAPQPIPSAMTTRSTKVQNAKTASPQLEPAEMSDSPEIQSSAFETQSNTPIQQETETDLQEQDDTTHGGQRHTRSKPDAKSDASESSQAGPGQSLPTPPSSSKRNRKSTKSTRRNPSGQPTSRQSPHLDKGRHTNHKPSKTGSGSNQALSPIISDTAAQAMSSSTSVHSHDTMRYWDDDGKPCWEDTSPARVRYPNPKISIADMNKRAKQIHDYIRKLKGYQNLTMPSTPLPNSNCVLPARLSNTVGSTTQQETANPLLSESRPRSCSTSSASSLSSASTLPLLDHDEEATSLTNTTHPAYNAALSEATSPTTPVPVSCTSTASAVSPVMGMSSQKQAPAREETSFEIMDRLTRQIISFQHKFGSLPAAIIEHHALQKKHT